MVRGERICKTWAVPLVSVVLIFLNEERFLKDAVQSVYNQQLSDWELILVDDGSTDASTPIARNLAAKDDRIRYLDHPGHQNRGMSASRNLGVAHATAPYIAFLDADDVWIPEKLAEQVDLLEKERDVAMVVGAIRFWYSWDPAASTGDWVMFPGGFTDEHRFDPPEAALALQPIGQLPNAGMDLLVRRTVFEAVGGFEERFPGLFEDQAFIIKVFLRYPVYISPRAWLRYRQHDESCIAQITRTEHLRLRGDFLKWLQDESGRHGDSRVDAAVRRARRALPYQKLYSRASESLPPEFKKRVKRSLAAGIAILRRRSARDRTARTV
jgi:glycosyltransferase involved in cell wall biosynthesis